MGYPSLSFLRGDQGFPRWTFLTNPANLQTRTVTVPLDSKRENSMKRFTAMFASAFLFVALAGSAFAMPQDAKDDMKEAGHETKEAAKDVGHATKKTAKKTGHAIKKGTKKAAHKTKKAAEKVEDKMDPN